MLKKTDWEDFIKIGSSQYYVLLVTSAENRVNLTGISSYKSFYSLDFSGKTGC